MLPPDSSGKTLLFVHQGALGDFIVAFPVLRMLRSEFARIDGICRAEFGELAKHLAVIDAFYPQDAARFASLYAGEMDPRVTDLLNSYDCILLFSFSQSLEESVRRVAADAVHRISPWPREEENIHVTDFLLDKLKRQRLLPEAATPAETALQGRRTPVDCRVKLRPGGRVVLCPGAGSPAKRWPLAGYLQLAGMLAAHGFGPEFLIGPAERDLGSLIDAKAAVAAPVHRGQGLVQLAQLLQAVHGYIGNDSAVSHLAAFLEIPSVVLFGPSNPDRWQPMGPFVTVLQADMPSCQDANGLDTGSDDWIWLKQLPPALVMKSFLGLMKP